MRLGALFLLLTGLALALFLTVPASADHMFVGANTCKMCHTGAAKGDQYGIWAASPHAKAFETLKTPEAEKAAKEKGLKVPASEAPECLKCHVTGFGADAAMFDAKFDKTQGVQCEACHGPGSDYKKIDVMKDHAKAVEAGLNPMQVADGTAEKTCVKCHNQESPFFKGFKFDEYFEKIKHPRPAK